MSKLLDEYRNKFGDQFPLMLCMSMTEDEIMELIQDCIDKGKPYEPEIEEGHIY